MRGKGTIFCYNGPAIIHPCYIITACSDHWLNCQSHTGCQLDTFSLLCEVGDLRLFMHICSDAMSNQVSYNSKTEAFRIFLDRC
mgnify:CR=1 FL=1